MVIFHSYVKLPEGKWSTDVSPGLRMTIEEVFVGLPFRCQSKNLYVLGSRPSMGPKKILARFVWPMFCPCRVSPCSPDGCLRRYFSPFTSQSDLVKLDFCKTWDAIFERLNITKLRFQKWTPNWGWQTTCFPSCFLQSKGLAQCNNRVWSHLDAKHAHMFYVYNLVMTNSLPWKDPPFLSSVNHLFNYGPSKNHGELWVSHNQRVKFTWQPCHFGWCCQMSDINFRQFSLGFSIHPFTHSTAVIHLDGPWS